MIPPFSRDEVRRHLIDLGYKNVTEEKLDLFVKDLSRLIKYEEKRAKKKDKKRKWSRKFHEQQILFLLYVSTKAWLGFWFYKQTMLSFLSLLTSRISEAPHLNVALVNK